MLHHDSLLALRKVDFPFNKDKKNKSHNSQLILG